MNAKELMLQYFERPQINDRIIKYIQKNNLKYQDLTNDQLLNMLDQLDLIGSLNRQLEQQDNIQSKVPLDMFEIHTNKKTLKVVIQKGRSFKNMLTLPQSYKFYISISGLHQRARTNSFPVSQKFTIDQNMILKVNPNLLKSNNNSPIQLAVVILANNGRKFLYSIKNVEWRYVLCFGSVSFDVQLAPYEGSGDLPCVGILSIRLQLTPLSKINMVPQRSITHQFELDKKNKQKANNRFYQYATQFWNDFKSIHRSFQSRRVKIYGDSQDKIFIPFCRFIYPLYNMRGIDSPYHALRFCSLIPYKQADLNKKSIHRRFHSVLAGSQGSIDDHSHLLCSLLLGFGLKAYVCVGYSTKGQHSWVITINKTSITFWQATKGIKYDYYSPKTYQFYKSIHTIYNHIQFYANIQLDDSISETKFNLLDETSWKKMDNRYLQDLPSYNTQISLLPHTFDIVKIEEDLQYSICQNIAKFRKSQKLGFDYDQKMGSIIATTLANYQIERITGQTFCQEQFQTAIKNYIPLKHTFKAFPIQLTTLDIQQVMSALKNQQKCRQILLAKGDSVHFAVKVKLTIFPQNIFAIWISIAVRYFKLV